MDVKSSEKYQMLTSGKLHTNIIDIFVGWKINEDAEMAALAKSFSVLNIQLRWFPLPLFCGEPDIIIHVGTGPAYGPLKLVKKYLVTLWKTSGMLRQ